MPRCLLPNCSREELPTAPGMPPGISVACAHVTPKGIPCPSSFGETYDDEAKQLIATEDVLWNLPDVGYELQYNQRPVPVAPKREEPPPGPKRKGKAKKPAVEAVVEKAPLAATEHGQEDEDDEVDRWQP